MHKGHFGAICLECGETANIPNGVEIWHCPLCDFNNFVSVQMALFENPRLGPSLTEAAYEYMESINEQPSDRGLAA